MRPEGIEVQGPEGEYRKFVSPLTCRGKATAFRRTLKSPGRRLSLWSYGLGLRIRRIATKVFEGFEKPSSR
jgi:hypothetical protein